MIMDIGRAAVIFWLFLPVLVLILYRLWRSSRLNKYSSTRTAQVTEVSYSRDSSAEASRAHLTYAYRVMGIDYTGETNLQGREHKPGEEIEIRYNPVQPEQSIVWKPVKRNDWIILALMWLGVSLGLDFMLMFIGLGVLLLTLGKRRTVQTGLKEAGYPSSIMVVIVFSGMLMLVMGIFVLIIAGFMSQNILWNIWNG